jgi:hypothetical protein
MKELGAPQESLWRWWKGIGAGILMPTDWSRFNMEPKPMYDTADVKEWFSAYTVAELGEMLPPSFSMDGLFCQIEHVHGIIGNSWYSSISDLHKEKRNAIKIFEADTEADARAAMWIYLKENGLI